MMLQATILHKNYETASSSPSVNIDWCYLGVTACKFALKTLFRITTLTEGGGEVTVARKKHVSCKGDKEALQIWGLLKLVSIYFVKDCLKKC